MSTRKLIKGDRYRAGLWKLEERCYEAHVRMPNAKFMIRTYRCTQGEAVAKFDSWVEAEGLDLAEDGAREACEGSIDDGMGTARRPLNREERCAMERRDRKIKKRQARKAASEADAARQSQDMGKEETEMQKVSKTDGQKTAAAGTKAPETEPARCYTLMCTGDLGTAPVMVFRNEGDANDMMRALEQVAKVTSPGYRLRRYGGPVQGGHLKGAEGPGSAGRTAARTCRRPSPAPRVSRPGSRTEDHIGRDTALPRALRGRSGRRRGRGRGREGDRHGLAARQGPGRTGGRRGHRGARGLDGRRRARRRQGRPLSRPIRRARRGMGGRGR